MNVAKFCSSVHRIVFRHVETWSWILPHLVRQISPPESAQNVTSSDVRAAGSCIPVPCNNKVSSLNWVNSTLEVHAECFFRRIMRDEYGEAVDMSPESPRLGMRIWVPTQAVSLPF